MVEDKVFLGERNIVSFRLGDFPCPLLFCTAPHGDDIVESVGELQQEELAWSEYEPGMVGLVTLFLGPKLFEFGLGKVVDEACNFITILTPHPLDCPGRDVLDDVVKKRGDDESVVPDPEVIDQDENNCTNVLEVPRLAVVTELVTESVLGVVIRLLDELVSIVALREKIGDPPKEAFAILCTC